jgi:hypothetical protein
MIPADMPHSPPLVYLYSLLCWWRMLMVNLLYGTSKNCKSMSQTHPHLMYVTCQKMRSMRPFRSNHYDTNVSKLFLDKIQTNNGYINGLSPAKSGCCWPKHKVRLWFFDLLQIYNCQNNASTHKRPWIWPQGSRESLSSGMCRRHWWSWVVLERWWEGRDWGECVEVMDELQILSALLSSVYHVKT